ncbi:ABC transporter substrate-binding protein [Nibricoccus aquaticus]|uniref:ABC transporter substrate-binding protein n=1 Tax=Nibricoccus aquaticus TaxID=2576891 RepID=A0A290QC11_9BACT|nr:extracellular solute-binding protein [Nibricoccus aquaticus]ATC66064.1 ABC transporter substrate-binding protein [Nibricoccus aquaticus]
MRLAPVARLLFLLGVFALTAPFRGLAAEAGGRVVEIEIPIQPAAYGTAFFDETAREFEKLRPGVRVRIAGDIRNDDKVQIRAMGGDFPDATDARLLYDTLIPAGKVRDLAPYLDGPNWEGDGAWRESFLPGVLGRWTRTDGVYAVPYTHAVWVVFYNEALFARHGWTPPKTWDEFFSLSEKVRATGLAPLTLPGVYMRYGDAFWQAALFSLAGAEGYRAYQQLAPGIFTDPRFVRAAGVLQRISRETLLNGWEGMTHTAAQQAFLDGKSAMTISATWMVSEMRGKIPDGFQLGAFNMPSFPDGAGPMGAVQARSAYFFMFATGDAERERATVDFFRFLTSRERVRAFAQRFDAPVALRAVRPDDYASPALRQIAEFVERAPAVVDAAPPASAAFLSFVSQGLNDARFQLMTGRITPEEFGARLERAAKGERERAREPDRVEVKHAGKALALCGLLVAVMLWLGWRARGGRKTESRRKADPAGGGVGRLRAPLAAGFVGPSLVLFGAFVILPALASITWAFTRWDGFTGQTWAGLLNFKWLLLESDTFWFALKNNLYLMIVPTLAVVPMALFFAAMIHRGVWGGGFFRAVFLFPNLLGGIAATLLWMNAYDPHGGLINAGLVKIGVWAGSEWLQSFAGYAWLSQANLYHALIPIYLWMACGFNLVLYLAAMQGISHELYEAAELDGASEWRQFFSITLPQIREVLAISAVFIVIAGLNTFEMIWLLTSQDPTSGTHVLSTLMVSTMFKEFQIGRATAIAVVMFVLVLAGSAVLLRVMRNREEG